MCYAQTRFIIIWLNYDIVRVHIAITIFKYDTKSIFTKLLLPPLSPSSPSLPLLFLTASNKVSIICDLIGNPCPFWLHHHLISPPSRKRTLLSPNILCNTKPSHTPSHTTHRVEFNGLGSVTPIEEDKLVSGFWHKPTKHHANDSSSLQHLLQH